MQAMLAEMPTRRSTLYFRNVILPRALQDGWRNIIIVHLVVLIARGDTTWKDFDDYTLKLNDVVGDDGATKLDVEPGWLVRLNIGVKM